MEHQRNEGKGGKWPFPYMFLHTFLSLQPVLDFTKSLLHSIYCLVFFKLLIHQLHPTMTFLKTSFPPIQFPFIYLLCNSILIHSLCMTKSAPCSSPVSRLLTFMLSSHSFNIHSFLPTSLLVLPHALLNTPFVLHSAYCEASPDVITSISARAETCSFYAAIFPSLGPSSYLAKGPTCSFHFYQHLYIVKCLHFSIFSQPSIKVHNIDVHFLVLDQYFFQF